MNESRKLYTIMFTDIEGYTALMQRDEQMAIDFRNQHREIYDAVTEQYSGKTIQYFGDGTLSVFESAIQAVKCAIEMQLQFREKTTMPVRIGLHMGDIVISKEDIIGDAVNIASRVESMAVAGSVLVSNKVAEELKNQKEIQVKSLGRFHFKNDSKPREIFAIEHPKLVTPKRSQVKGKFKKKEPVIRQMLVYVGISWISFLILSYVVSSNNLDPGLIDLSVIIAFFGFISFFIWQLLRPRLGWRSIALHALNIVLALMAIGAFLLNPTIIEVSRLPAINLFGQKQQQFSATLNSIAVLPFVNNTGDQSQEYLFKGMHEGLIHEIGHLSNIRIPSSTSTLSYATSSKSMKRIARELEVDALIEGSLTRIDSVIQFRIKLINVFPQEKSLWAHEFNTTIDGIPDLYHEVTKNVALQINGVLQPKDIKQLSKMHAPNPGAYEAYLKGQYYAGFLTPDGIEIAENYFTKAIEIDPEFALGYGGLSLVWVSKKQMGYTSGKIATPFIKLYHEKSMQLDSTNAENWTGEAAILTWTDFAWERGEKAFLKSIELNPNSAPARAAYAHLLMILNQFDEARVQMDYAEQLDPLNPWTLSFSGAMHFYEGKIITAFKKFEQLKKLEPDHPMLNRALLGKYANTTQYDQGIEVLKRFIHLEEGYSVKELIDDTYQKTDFEQTLKITAQRLEAISKTSFVAPATIYFIYELLGDEEKRIFWMKKMQESKDGYLPYNAIRNNDPLQNDPRYIKIMQEIGLW